MCRLDVACGDDREFHSVSIPNLSRFSTKGHTWPDFLDFFLFFSQPRMASKSQKKEKNTATRGHIATRGRAWPRVAPQPRVALRGHLRPRVAELGHVWLHEFDPRNKRRSHTWAIQTWSWRCRKLVGFYSHVWPIVAHGLAPEASYPLLATRDTQLTHSHAWYRYMGSLT